MSAYDKVKSIVLDQLDIDESSITLDANLVEDLGADSLDVAEMVIAFEDEFNIEVDDEQIETIKSVGDIVNYFENR